MKSDETKNKRAGHKNIPPLPKRSKNVIDSGTPRIHIQYPAKVGYHGTDEEKELSPEE